MLGALLPLPVVIMVLVREVNKLLVSAAAVVAVIMASLVIIISEISVSAVPVPIIMMILVATLVPLVEVYSAVVVLVLPVVLWLSQGAWRDAPVLIAPPVVEANILRKLIPHILVEHIPLIALLIQTRAKVVILSALNTLQSIFASYRALAAYMLAIPLPHFVIVNLLG